MYGELASWFHLISHPDEYAAEADHVARIVDAVCGGAAKTLLELGSGGGNNAYRVRVSRSPVRAAGHRRPGLEWNGYSEPMEEAPATSNRRTWPVTGQVIQMDAENNILTMWVRGYNDSQPSEMPIPEAMPGWALRPETAFEAEVPWQVRDSHQLLAADLTNFKPLDFSYSQPEELVELLANPQKLDEFYDR